MNRNLIILLLIIIIGSTFSCKKEEKVESTYVYIEVLFPPNRLGDLSYYDILLYSLQKECIEKGYELTIHIPQTISDGGNIVKEWENSQLNNGERSLLIVASNEYLDCVKGITNKTHNKDVLLFETDYQSDSFYTLRIGHYGLSFYLAQISKYILDNISFDKFTSGIIMPNSKDIKCIEFVDGFNDGSKYKGAELPLVTYLQHEQNKGYNIPDSAYIACSKLPKNCLLIFTNSGFSDVGVNNYSISNNCYFNVVNNRNLINNFNVISIIEVKIGNIIVDFIDNWVNNEHIMGHQVFLFDSPYINVTMKNLYEFLENEDFINEYKNIAIEEERKYEDR